MNNKVLISLYRKILLSRYKLKNGVYGLSYITLNENEKICFDFSDRNFIHYGDMLFYLPLIIFLSKDYDISILIKNEDLNFIKFFINDCNTIKVINDLNNHDGLIISSPYVFIKNINNAKYFGLGIPSILLDIPYPSYLAKIFGDFFIKNDNFYDSFCLFFIDWKNKFKNKPILRNIKNLYSDENLVLISPYISSGKFRDLLKFKRNKIIKYFISNFSHNNFTPLLVGSSSDKNLYFRNRIDFRGMDITFVMMLCCTDKVVCGVGFDNFWMHFFDLIGKSYYVKFRGRILNFNKEIHFRSINISFTDSANKNYI